MATISRRSGGWFVQIRRKGFDPEFKTLRTKADAERWAREREALMDKGAVEANRRDLKSMTLGDLIDRYLTQVTPTKRSADTERLRLGKMRRASLCTLALSDLSVAPFAACKLVSLAESGAQAKRALSSLKAQAVFAADACGARA